MAENSAEQENVVQAPVMINADTAKTDLQPGEKGFTIVLLAFCAFLLYRSMLLWQQAPGINGPAIVPVLASGLPTLLLAISVITNFWKTTPLSSSELSAKEKYDIATSYLFSKNVVVTLIAIVVYCVLLNMGISFYIVSSLFLWGLMSFLAKGNYIKNILWTALTMAFIFGVFQVMFSVVMP